MVEYERGLKMQEDRDKIRVCWRCGKENIKISNDIERYCLRCREKLDRDHVRLKD